MPHSSEDRPWLPPSMQIRPPRKVRQVTVQHAGKHWHACWEIEADGRLCVFGAYRWERVSLRGREPEEVAQRVLLKLVKGWLAG